MRSEEAQRTIIRPYITEKTFEMVEKQNKITFLVNEKASKRAIKEAVELLYGVKVDSVRTARTFIGKKAYVKLKPETPASELSTRLGLV